MTRRLSDDVARRLERWIVDQGLGPGTQLPTEKVLCERFGVSRAVIREAVSRLKADGCVWTRQGSGAFVAALPGEGSFRLDAGAGEPIAASQELGDVFELRFLMETGAAELAALRRSDDDLVRIEQALWRMDDALASGVGAVDDDDAFHVAIAAATRNRQLERFQVFMGRQLSASRAPTWSPCGLAQGRAHEAQGQHREIFEAIRAGDAAAARAAAARHLVCAAARLGLDPRRWVAGVEREDVVGTVPDRATTGDDAVGDRSAAAMLSTGADDVDVGARVEQLFSVKEKER